MLKRQSRVIRSFAWRPGQTERVHLRTTDHVLAGVTIFISGKMKLSTAGTGTKVGSIANIIKDCQFLIEGFDSGLGRYVGQDSRVRIPGWAMHWAKVDANSSQPRISFLDPFNPIFASGAQTKDVNSGSTAEQEIKCALKLPFSVPRGRQPYDALIDLANLKYADLVLEMGEITDLLRGNPVMESNDVEVKIVVDTLVPADAPAARGNAISPELAMRRSLEILTSASDNTEFRIPIRFSQANIESLVLYATDDDDDDKGKDSIIEHIRLERNNDAIIDLPAEVVRNKNISAMALTPQDSANAHVLHDSGVYIVAPHWTEFTDRNLIVESAFPGQGDSASDLVLSVKKPTGNAKIYLLKNSIRMSDTMAAASRAQRDQTAAQRAISAEARQAEIETQRAVEQAAGSV